MRDSINEALRYALRLINVRDRTEKEIVQRLTDRGFSTETVESVVERLKHSGLVDDRRAAEGLINYGIRVKGLGLKALQRLCAERGVDETIVKELLTRYDEQQRAEELVLKKLKKMNGLSIQKKWQRLYGYLYRRGYSSEVIRKVLSKYLSLEG